MNRSTLVLATALVIMLSLPFASVANADAAAICFITEAAGTCGPSYPPSTVICADGTQGPSYIVSQESEISKCANALAGAGGRKECVPTAVNATWDAYGCPNGSWGIVAQGVTTSCRSAKLTGDECTGPKPIEPQGG